jgi:hypothetical protein
MNYIVTTLPRSIAEVQMALGDWSCAHSKDGNYAYPDPKKIGYKIESPVVRDNRDKLYLCELVETHYNAQADTLIFVWKPTLAIEDLPEDLQHVPDHNPTLLQHKFAGEQELEVISTGKPKTEA